MPESSRREGPPSTPPWSRSDLERTIRNRALPALPARGLVLLPTGTLPFAVGDEALAALDDAMAADRLLVVAAQKNDSRRPGLEDFLGIGTLALVLRMIRPNDEQAHAIVRGISRVRLLGADAGERCLRLRIESIEEERSTDLETAGLEQAVLAQFAQVVAMNPGLPDELVHLARGIEPPGALADFVASVSELSLEEHQGILQALSVKQRFDLLTHSLGRLLQALEVGKKIQAEVQGSMDEQQKEFLLRRQLDAIRKELGEGDEDGREMQELRGKLERANLPFGVRKEADRELRRIVAIPAQSPEHAVIRTYLDWLGDLPWAVSTDDDLDLIHARRILDEDHTGLDKIKERILEYLAIRRYKPDAKSPILCFVGPPGTGKTSLGRSIARALGRKFWRQSLGGLRDEAEIRGHRRTYIGAMPGSIIQGIRRAGSNNPLFMLDEIDKLGVDFRGDPASALLEVLDPEQNVAFVDHYLDLPFDLSHLLFICTANLLDTVLPALRDRMEVIHLAGYTELEKLAIAERHLVPKAIRANGLEPLGISFTREALSKVIREYTSEAGLRNLEREIEALLRRTAKLVAEGIDAPRAIDGARVRALLGPERFLFERAQNLDAPGAALGLAWTPVGGKVLVVESALMPGGKDLLLTGRLGDIMKESAHAALTYVRSHAGALGIDSRLFATSDVHVHVPAGAIAKDGPSAGVAICTSLVSLLTGRLPTPKTAMTGEITIRGKVLPVGGIKEKVLAAHRAQLEHVILPVEAEKDLEDVPEEVRCELTFHPVATLEEVLAVALVGPAAPAPAEHAAS